MMTLTIRRNAKFDRFKTSANGIGFSRWLLAFPLLGAGIAQVATTAATAATAANAHAIDKKQEVIFNQLDGNHDRFLSREESQAIVDSVFKTRDTTKRGSLTKDEYRGWITKRSATASGDGSLSRKEVNEIFTKKFTVADRDGDGKISLIEFAGWKSGKALGKFLTPKKPKPAKQKKATSPQPAG